MCHIIWLIRAILSIIHCPSLCEESTKYLTHNVSFLDTLKLGVATAVLLILPDLWLCDGGGWIVYNFFKVHRWLCSIFSVGRMVLFNFLMLIDRSGVVLLNFLTLADGGRVVVFSCTMLADQGGWVKNYRFFPDIIN